MSGADVTRPHSEAILPEGRPDLPPDNSGIPVTGGGAPWLALFTLTMCFALAFTDRQILNLMVDHMKRDFVVTDKQIGFLLNTVPAWAPTMFIRQYGMDPQWIGVIYGIMILVLGIVAGLASPAVNSIFARKHADAPMRTTLIGLAILLVAGISLLLAGSPMLALVSVAIITFGYVFPLPMAGTALQLASPPRLRGMAASYYFVIVSVIGVGVGPTLVPFTADNLLGDPDNLNTAISIVTIVCAVVCFAFMRIALGGFRIERAAVTNAAAR